jgi:hypothetical protein
MPKKSRKRPVFNGSKLYRSVVREVVISSPCRTNTQGLKITEEKVLPL